MARIPQGILGGLRGRVANVIGASWKGINYIRSMPLSVANPNTVLQQAQRGAFTQVVAAARLLLTEIIATYWDPFARYMSGYNHFISINIDAFATAGLTTPADFFSGRGILTGVADLVVTGSEATNDLTWTDTDLSGIGDALGGDKAIFVWYNVTQDYWKAVVSETDDRADTPFTTEDLDFVENDVIECYMFYTRVDHSKISDSSHDQCVAAA